MTDYLLKTLKENRYKKNRPKNKVPCKKTVKWGMVEWDEEKVENRQ